MKSENNQKAAIVDEVGKPFYRNLLLLKTFVEREGHACVPVVHIEQGVHLGRWVAAQRSRKKNNLLNDAQINQLEQLTDWVWRASDYQWDLGIERLKEFNLREGHINVPNNHIENRFALGDWLLRQRKRFRLNRLDPNQLHDLSKFEFDEAQWREQRKRKTWEQRYLLLYQYSMRTGSSVVPRNHIESDFALGVWVNSLRSQYSKGMLKDEMIEQLERLPKWRWANPRVSV